jgi:PAS domain S-box-containing protein
MQDPASKILLVEDEALIADDEARRLEDEGYVVSAVGTGERAVEFIRSHAGMVDLILMDINLGGGIDGTQAAREILKENDIPILFLSVYTDRETVERTEKVSSYGYVVKTSGIAVLSASIRMAINLHRALRELQTAEEVTGPEDDFEGIIDDVIRRPSRPAVSHLDHAMLRAAMEATADGILTVTRDGKISAFNTRFAKMWGVPAEALPTKSNAYFLDSVADQLADPDGFRESVRQLIQNEDKAGFDVLQFKDGRIFERYSQPQYLDGRPVGRVCSFRDVTEAKRMEKALRESEEKYRLASSLMTDYYFRVTLGDDGRAVVDVISNNFHAVTGRTIDDVKFPDLWHNFIHPDDLDGLLDLLKKLQTEGGEGDIECRSFIRGRERWIHIAARTVDPSKKGELKTIIGAVKDITERKRIEAELRESRRLLDEVQEISKVGGWEFNAENGRMTWTDEIYRLNGVDKTFDPNDRAKVVALYVPEDGKIFEQAFAAAVRNGTPYDLELRMAPSDGKLKWVRTMGKPKIKDGKVVKIVGNAMDITERKRAEDALRQTVREKEVLMKELQHRVKNSLGVVSGLLGLETSNLADSRSREIFVNTRARIQSISLIYDQLSRFNDPGNVDFSDLIMHLTASIFKTYTTETGRISLKTNLDAISLDTKRAVPLALILNELVTNALKYSHPEGDAGEIRIDFHKSDGRIILSVADDGIGFPEGMDPNTSESTGLSLIRMLAGQIDAAVSFQRDGRGICVTLEFKA